MKRIPCPDGLTGCEVLHYVEDNAPQDFFGRYITEGIELVFPVLYDTSLILERGKVLKIKGVYIVIEQGDTTRTLFQSNNTIIVSQEFR
jgi:hypothetical protein